jgi:hypothetical protein
MKFKILFFFSIFPVILKGGGRIAYPAKGNICIEEGTIEMWIKTGFEPEQKSDEYKLILPLLQFYEPEIKFNISISYICVQGGKAQWSAGIDFQGEKLFRLTAIPIGWKKDEWHHIALSWKYNKAIFYLDGKAVCEVKSNKPVVGEIKNGLIYIGDRWTNEKIKTEVVIDDLRISCIERKAEEIGFNFSESLKPDPFTLLLENFEEISENKNKETKPVIISGLSGEKGGEIIGGKLVNGRFGKGLSLF